MSAAGKSLSLFFLVCGCPVWSGKQRKKRQPDTGFSEADKEKFFLVFDGLDSQTAHWLVQVSATSMKYL